MKIILLQVLCILSFSTAAQAQAPTIKIDAKCSRGTNKGRKCVIIQECPELWEKIKDTEIDKNAAFHFEDYYSIKSEIDKATCKFIEYEANLDMKHTRHVCCQKKNLKPIREVPKIDAKCTRGTNKGGTCVIIQECPELWQKIKDTGIDKNAAFHFENYYSIKSEIDTATCKFIEYEANLDMKHTRYVCCPS